MRIPDRQKQRREYLKKKAGAYSLCAVGGLMFLPVAVVALVCGIFTFHCFNIWLQFDEKLYLYLSIALGLLTWAGSCGCCSIYRAVLQEKQEAASLPYVPPVTVDTLTAEEILVRSSQQPVQEQSTMLLRAAGGNVEIAVVELLRASEE